MSATTSAATMYTTISTIDIGSGDFEFVTNNNDRKIYVSAFNAINELELWGFISTFTDGFGSSNDTRINDIYNKIRELGYKDHSGTSFIITMNNMRFLAKNGIEHFAKLFL